MPTSTPANLPAPVPATILDPGSVTLQDGTLQDATLKDATLKDATLKDATLKDNVECGVGRATLDQVPAGRAVRVEVVDGDDALAARLIAVGFWPGTQVERITAAPFGGPLLFRLHGFRFALRRSEAARVQVVVCDA